MGKWATYQKRGGSAQFGVMAPPNPPPVGFTAITGGAGVITVTRLDAIPAGATQMLWRAIDTTTNLLAVAYNSTLTGLVTGRVYKVQAAWFNGAIQVSDASIAATPAAG